MQHLEKIKITEVLKQILNFYKSKQQIINNKYFSYNLQKKNSKKLWENN